MTSERLDKSPFPGGIRFPSTHWSLLTDLKAKSGSETSGMISELYQSYAGPIHAFLRNAGLGEDEAKDRTHDFFLFILETGLFLKADRKKGRLRTFLLTCLENFLKDLIRRDDAEVRGGGEKPIALDADGVEGHRSIPIPDLETPQSVYEKRWALALIERALAAVRLAYASRGDEEFFDQGKDYISRDPNNQSFAAWGKECGKSAESLALKVHRLRRRVRHEVEKEIAKTVADPEDVEDELHHLFEVFKE